MHFIWNWKEVLPSFVLGKGLESYGQSESEVAQSCPTLCDPMDCSLPGSSIHGILQARILEWVAISFSRGSSQPRDRTQVFTIWATRAKVVSKEHCPLRYARAYWRRFNSNIQADLRDPVGSFQTVAVKRASQHREPPELCCSPERPKLCLKCARALCPKKNKVHTLI